MTKSHMHHLLRLVLLIATFPLLGAAVPDSLSGGTSSSRGLGTSDKPKSDPMPQDQVRHYISVSATTSDLLGDMDLSRSSARFSKLTSTMKLEYSGYRMGGGPADWEFSGEVFRIVNAGDYFAANRGKNGFCKSPARWLTILDLSSRLPPLTHSIRVGMLTIEDWHDYKPTDFGACMADTFVLKPAEASAP